MNRGWPTFATILTVAYWVIAHATVASPLDDSISHYGKRYPLPDVHDKLVDDHGNGFEALRGVRNFRMVLQGVMYRGGANNDYRRPKRKTMNPLPPEGLLNLCQEGFSTAIYLYPTNYNTADKSVSCKTREGQDNTLSYLQISALNGPRSERALLTEIHRHLGPNSNHPIYTHCWNGWHASGYISALALRQFCGMPAEAAVSYWDENTDGNEHVKNADQIRASIRHFQGIPELSIPTAVRDAICPR